MAAVKTRATGTNVFYKIPQRISTTYRGGFRSTHGIQGTTAYRYNAFIMNFMANPMIRSLQIPREIPMGRLWFNIKFVVLQMTENDWRWTIFPPVKPVAQNQDSE